MAKPNITVSERFWAKVEKTETCWNWTSPLRPDGYGQIKDCGRIMLPHRLSYELSVGPIPSGMHIDHICHNRACVNPSHLRPVTRKQNMENRAGIPANNTSGVRGVQWDKARGQWRATLGHLGKTLHVGRFATAKDAEKAVVAKRLALFTHNDADRKTP